MTLPAFEISALEEMNFNAWPALQSVHYDGWLVRKTGGLSRRVNSVNTVTHGRMPLAGKIEHCEALFANWGQRRVFRITPLSEPELEPLLLARGYVVEAPTNVMVAELAQVQADTRVALSDVLDPAWPVASARLRGLPDDEAAILSAQHQVIAVPTVRAAAGNGDTVMGVGAAAIERGWAGLHGIHVVQDGRRQGLARAISVSLLARAYQLGARLAWLQVEQANAAAIPLYRSLGFETAWTYRHLVRAG